MCSATAFLPTSTRSSPTCSSPDSYRCAPRVLLQNLLHRGLITADATDMGISIADDHTVLTGGGDRSAWLLAMGPLIRGTYWETVAVPELRGQARRVAETVLDRVHIDEEGTEQLEYML
jgi:uncharacterized NAD(P)/FAD-binding protein YdhS